MIDFSSPPIAPSMVSSSPNAAAVSMMNNSNGNSLLFRSSSTSSGSSVPGGGGGGAAGGGLFGVIGSGAPTTPAGPTLSLDLNEFPSLGGTSINTFSQSSAPGRPAYVGMVKDNVTSGPTNNEFNIQSEDFPALPGAASGTAGVIGGPPGSVANAISFGTSDSARSDLAGVLGLVSSTTSSVTNGPDGISSESAVGLVSSTTSGQPASAALGALLAASGSGTKKGALQVNKEGHVTNIPPGMLTDQWGIAGLVAMMQTTEKNPNLYSLAVGYDISTINMNLSSKERIYHSYPGPWSDKPLKPYEIDYPVPSEYQTNSTIRDRLAPIKLSAYSDDLLFFLFYFFAGEALQLLATAELHNRDWRYHKDERIWITRRQTSETGAGYERGSYVFFDPVSWVRSCKDMTIEYDRLEPRPTGMLRPQSEL